MNGHTSRLLAVLLAVLMTGAVFAPLGAATDASLASSSVTAESTPAEIHESLYDETGETELFLYLPDIAEAQRQGGPDAVIDALKSQAELTQEPVVAELERLDGVAVEDSFWIRNSVLVTADLDEVSLETLAAIDGVESIEPNAEFGVPEPVAVNPDVEPSGTAPTYGLEQIRAPETWQEFGVTGEGVRVVVVDSGVYADHPDIDLAAQDGWYDPESGSSTPEDNHGHGTHVSGTISGGDASGTAIGVAPDVELGVARSCGSQCGTDVIIDGIQWAVDTDSDVVNLSLGGAPSGSFVDVVYNAMDAGTLVVSSIGNNGEGQVGTPGAVYDSIASGATNENEQVTNFSGGKLIEEGEFAGAWLDHWPAQYITPDIAAPGEEVYSANAVGGDMCGSDEYCAVSGTSMSSPHKAGAAALILSANPDLGPWEVKELMMETAWKPSSWDPNDAQWYDSTTGIDSRYGAGIIDVYAAVEQAGGGGERGTVQGTVTDDSGMAIEGATVSVGVLSTETDASGNYELSVSAGTHTVTAEALGYESDSQSVSVGEDETVTVNFALAEQEITTVAVVDDGSYGSDVAGLIEGATGDDVTVETLSSSEALGSDHDVYVVQNIDSGNVNDFVSATSGDDVGVIYLDQYEESADEANGVRQFASVSSDVDGVGENYQDGADGPYYAVTQSHPIVDGYGVGDQIPIHTGQYADHAWVTGTNFDVIADVSAAGSTPGIGLAVDDASATVLAASSGLSQYAPADAHTSEDVGVLVNSIEYLAADGGEEPPEPPEEGFIRLGDASAAEGGTATVAMDTDVSNVAGYQARIDYDSSVFSFVDASGVDLDDPVVNDEDGTVTLSASQASGVDAPTLAELTFEAVGSDGDSTDLVFDQEFTQLNTEDSVVQPQEYVSGSLTVGGAECAVLGDVDDSGDVTSLDATLTQQYIAGLDPGGFENPECADVTDDGDITPADVTGIHQIIVGIWA